MSEIETSASLPTTPWDDWITIWHSEWAALVTDREVHEAFLRGLDLWASTARAAARNDPAGRAGAIPPPGSEAALASPVEPMASLDDAGSRLPSATAGDG